MSREFVFVDEEYRSFRYSFVTINKNKRVWWIDVYAPISSLRRQNYTYYRIGEAVLNSPELWELAYPALPSKLRTHILRHKALAAFI